MLRTLNVGKPAAKIQKTKLFKAVRTVQLLKISQSFFECGETKVVLQRFVVRFFNVFNVQHCLGLGLHKAPC
jgi:hypothetical protein